MRDIIIISMPIKNKTQLITYPDSLGGNLNALGDFLVKHCLDIFPGGVHILPPYPSSGDRGFAPRTYYEIDPQFGNWEDICRIGQNFDVLLDVMVNHISRQSIYFQDFAKRGRRSEYADLFITLDKIWPSGDPPGEDVAKIFLRRPEHPFTDVAIEESGETERVWATFGGRDWSEQIDIDVYSKASQKLFRKILAHMSRQGVKILRLDAVAYVTKKPGTSCFFVEPEIYEFLDWFRQEAGSAGIELLPEVHADGSILKKLSDHGYWVYDFVLPILVLHTLFSRSARMLKDHLKTCPHQQFTTLDTHDGIPVLPDIEGILDIEGAQRVVQTCLERGANLNRILSAQHKAQNEFDAHQINCTYYSALDCNDDAYLAARAIQFFTPGVPQIYYVGLLAGENDQEEVRHTGEGRAINRHNFNPEEIEASLQKPVVERLLKLIRFRNEYPAFQGSFEIEETGDQELKLMWQKGESRCLLAVDLKTIKTRIEYLDREGRLICYPA